MTQLPEQITGTGGKALHMVVGILLVTVTLLCALILGVALYDLVTSTSAIEHLLAEARCRVACRDLAGETMAPWATALCARLSALSAGSLNANTISFLFQVFSVGLIGAGAFLVREYGKHLSAVEGRVKEYQAGTKHLAPFHEARSRAATMLAEMTNAHAMLSLCRAVQNEHDKTPFAVVRARDAATHVKAELGSEHVDLSESEKKCLGDLAGLCLQYAKRPMKSRGDAKEKVALMQYLEDIVQALEIIVQMLRDGDYVARYNVALKRLSLVPEEHDTGT